MWTCSCEASRLHSDCEQVCPKCGDVPAYAPDAVQVARFQGIKKLVELGRYSEYPEGRT